MSDGPSPASAGSPGQAPRTRASGRVTWRKVAPAIAVLLLAVGAALLLVTALAAMFSGVQQWAPATAAISAGLIVAGL